MYTNGKNNSCCFWSRLSTKKKVDIKHSSINIYEFVEDGKAKMLNILMVSKVAYLCWQFKCFWLKCQSEFNDAIVMDNFLVLFRLFFLEQLHFSSKCVKVKDTKQTNTQYRRQVNFDVAAEN